MKLKQNKKAASITALVCSMILIFGSVINVSAVELSDNTAAVVDEKAAMSVRPKGIVDVKQLGNTYINCYISQYGINKNITLVAYYPTGQLPRTLDVRMMDHNWNVVWEEKAAVKIIRNDRGEYEIKRTFWCGSNVRSIQARISGGDIHSYRGSCEVWI